MFPGLDLYCIQLDQIDHAQPLTTAEKGLLADDLSVRLVNTKKSSMRSHNDSSMLHFHLLIPFLARQTPVIRRDTHGHSGARHRK